MALPSSNAGTVPFYQKGRAAFCQEKGISLLQKICLIGCKPGAIAQIGSIGGAQVGQFNSVGPGVLEGLDLAVQAADPWGIRPEADLALGIASDGATRHFVQREGFSLMFPA